MRNFFYDKILSWHQSVTRKFPWTGEKDPYRLWISEVILQQTRAEQGLPFYLKFVETFPSVKDLAQAEEENLLRVWQGLGYYSRARNLHSAARKLLTENNGIFPSSYEQIRQIKGVGDYTAAAIASFAFNLPHAVVDGNVYRVLSRFFAIETPIDSAQGKTIFKELANELLIPTIPGACNQAIMDLGAMVCKPVNPNCSQCPLSTKCLAFSESRITDLPVKSKSLKRKTRFFNYFVFASENLVLIFQREKKDVWYKLHEFWLVESNRLFSLNYAKNNALKEFSGRLTKKVFYEKQHLTHQTIEAAVFFIEKSNLAEVQKSIGGKIIPLEKIDNFAFPGLLRNFVSKELLTLSVNS